MKYVLKCYLALLYEALLMLALTLVVTAVVYMLLGDASQGWKHLLLQSLLWLVVGAYFVRCWTASGQTLASQTWKLKVVDRQGQLLGFWPAVRRFILAAVLLLPVGLTFWWALVDREHCYLHDRLLGSRIRPLPVAN